MGWSVASAHGWYATVPFHNNSTKEGFVHVQSGTVSSIGISARAYGSLSPLDSALSGPLRRAPSLYAQLCFADDTVVSLRGHQWLIGKSPVDTDICLAKPTVSRMHARIWKKEDAYYIEDLHSRNGTMVEGKLLEPEEKRRLESGMRLSFAEYTCTFTEKQGNMN